MSLTGYAAIRLAEKAGLNFGRVFRGQFTLGPKSSPTIDGWRQTVLGPWHLQQCRSIPYARFRDPNGDLAAILLGIGVDEAGRLVRDGDAMPAHLDKFVTGLAGRYVLLTPREVYADPTGSMGCLFDPTERIVAASPLLALTRDPSPNPRFDLGEVQNGRASFSFGLTYDAKLRQVMPNHRLDLDSFRLERFWPKPGQEFAQKDPIPGMVKRLGDVAGAIAQKHTTLIPLSGGFDSRNLAAAAKPHLGNVLGSYSFVINWQSKLDAQIAAELADRLGLDHQVLNAAELSPSPAARRRRKLAFHMATGYVGVPNDDILSGVAGQVPKGVVLRGNVMEMLKANHWKRGHRMDAAAGHHDRDYAVDRLAILPKDTAAARAQFRPDYDQWYDALPKAAQNVAYDFAFTELLLPAWQPKFYGYTRNFLVNPFSCRQLIASCLALPLGFRRTGRANAAFLQHAAPELCDIPFVADLKRQSAA